MWLKRALRNNKDKSSSIHIISWTSPYLCPRHSRVHAFKMSSPFCCPLHSHYLAGSFAVRSGDHLRFWDHLRSNLGIICGRGSFAVSGSFAALYSSPISLHNMMTSVRSSYTSHEPISSLVQLDYLFCTLNNWPLV